MDFDRTTVADARSGSSSVLHSAMSPDAPIDAGADADEVLRQSLLDVTERYTGRAVGEQLAAVRRLGIKHQHSINAIRVVDLVDVRSWRYNCHAFTFGLWSQDVFWELQETHPNAWPNGPFVVEHLLPLMSQVTSGRIAGEAAALYFRGGDLKHSGLNRGGVVQSKWGDCHTWEHGLFEVPSSYGDRIQLYHVPEVDVVVDAYVRFAKTA